MPLNDPPRVTTKQYGVTAGAGTDQSPVRPTAANKRRVHYAFQNTGSQAGYFSWDEAFPGELSRSLLVMPGDYFSWPRAGVPCPVEAGNFSSVLGTTFAIIEGIS